MPGARLDVVAPAFAEVMEGEHPGRLVTEAGARFWPPRLELWVLAVPAGLENARVVETGMR
ncbi:MAG: hypothetical protein HY322_18400 [Betaproteobacteria bacterium]|nr:hypothetical protein [Betaproteobacteria bacterium]